MSFLEMLDALNEDLINRQEPPIAFEHDCREGICGACGFVINGVAHGGQRGTTVCQLSMRFFKDGDTLTLEPWRAQAFPVIRDLFVDRSAFDRIIQAGGYITAPTGSAPDANVTLVPKENADTAFDAAACIGCGACVAACPNAAAMLFTSAKVTHLNSLPQGQPRRDQRTLANGELGPMARSGIFSCKDMAKRVADLLKGKASLRLCGVRKLPSATLARAARTISVLALLASASAWAQTSQENAPPCPSASAKLPMMTYEEQVQDLANADCRTSLLDSIQFIPLGKDENRYLSFGFWIRERGEYASNPNWSDTPPGNAYLMQRYFLHMDLHLGERFLFFGELASSLVSDRNGGPRPGIDEEKMYVHQGFFDLGLWKSGSDSLTLRAGRQEVALGSENLVSTRDGRNIRRSLDGFRLTWTKQDWTVDLIAVRPTLENSGFFDDPPNHAGSFWAAYAVHPLRFLPRGNIDLYYMGLDNKSVPFDGKGTGQEQRESIGTRLWGTTEHWDYNDEFTYQWGWFRSGAIRAWASSTEQGYRIDQAPLAPRFGLRAVAFSGDQSPSSHNLGTFNSIYEKGPYFGYAELFARRNLVALQPLADLKLRKAVSLTFNPAFFWRESTSDGLYSVSNAVIVSGLKSNARYIATQASAQLQWRMTRNLTWFTECGHFFPDEFIKQATPGRNLNYWTGWLDIRY